MLKLLYALILGLVGAAVVHITVLLLVPAYSERDAWTRLSARAPEFTVTQISGFSGDNAFPKGADPLFASIACRYSLTGGVVHMIADGDLPFWSVSVYDRRGQIIYSLNDRTATDRELDLVIATPARMVELRKELPEDYANSVFVETEEIEGMIVARTFVPDDSWSGMAKAFLQSAECRLE